MDIETTMTSEKIKTPDAAKRAGIGRRLKIARESLRLSERDVAARMHLSVKMIPIMENEDFDNGPPATFMRGYLRSYARLLDIPEHEVKAAIAQLESCIPQTPEPCAPPILKTQSSQNSHRYLRGMTFVVVPVLALLVCVWWSSHSKDLMTAIKPVAATLSASISATPPVTEAKQPVAAATTTSPATPTAPVPPIAVAQPTSTTTPAVNAAKQNTSAPATPPKNAADPQVKSTTEDSDTDMAQPPEPGLEQSDNSSDNNDESDDAVEPDNHRNIASTENDNNVY